MPNGMITYLFAYLQACLSVITFTGHCREITHTPMMDMMLADGQQAVKKEVKGLTP